MLEESSVVQGVVVRQKLSNQGTEKRILIVGAGPTGLSAALFLFLKGFRPVVVEKNASTSLHSKAFGVNARTLELHEETGVTAELLRRGWKMEALRLWRKDRQLANISFSRVRHKYPFMLIHSQAETEKLLAETVEGKGLVIRWKTEFKGFSTNNPQCVVLDNPAQPQSEEEFDIVLGADGAGSPVRKSVGVDFPGTRFEETWRLADVELETPLSPDRAHVFLLDEGALFMVCVKGSVWRVLGNSENLLGCLPRGTQVGSVVWESDFGISHRMAGELRKGNVFLAGDAAHIHSGIGARGMNLGIEDAYVFARLCAEARLDQYEEIRLPAIKKILRQTHGAMTVPRGKSPLARFVRKVSPLLPLAAPVLERVAPPWVLGLDHEVGV